MNEPSAPSADRTRSASEGVVEPELRCFNCGYTFAGLKPPIAQSYVCPECGLEGPGVTAPLGNRRRILLIGLAPIFVLWIGVYAFVAFWGFGEAIVLAMCAIGYALAAPAEMAWRLRREGTRSHARFAVEYLKLVIVSLFVTMVVATAYHVILALILVGW